MLNLFRSLSRAAAVTGGAVAFLGVACGTPTTSTEVWKNPSYAAGPVKNVVVFGGRMNESNRRTLEDGFVHALTAHGVHATPSYRMFPGAVPDQPTAQQAIQRSGYDGVLVSSMRGTEEGTTVEPGVAYGSPLWRGYYGPGFGSTWAPGYVVTGTFVKFETTLWDSTGSGKMIWHNLTQTENPSSSSDFLRSLLKNVIPKMEQAGLIPAKAQGAPVSSFRPEIVNDSAGAGRWSRTTLTDEIF
jgi:hypothetical protein